MAETYTHRLRVRFSETDAQGVVFYANYVAYFDILITELWRDVAGGYSAMVDAGADMVVVEVTTRYHASAVFDDDLDLNARVLRLGNTSMSTAVEIVRASDGALISSGEIHHVFVDPATMTKTPIPADVRAALEPYVLEDEPAAAG
jgi:acyl-CoA thioester hydrolase